MHPLPLFEVPYLSEPYFQSLLRPSSVDSHKIIVETMPSSILLERTHNHQMISHQDPPEAILACAHELIKAQVNLHPKLPAIQSCMIMLSYFSYHCESLAGFEITPLFLKDSADLRIGDGSLTYAELDTFSSSLANHLSSRGIGPEAIVPICFEKSMWTIVVRNLFLCTVI